MKHTELDNAARRFRAQFLAANVPDEVADRVFGYAWREGHANGMHEVEMIYDDLADLVNIAYLAGKESA